MISNPSHAIRTNPISTAFTMMFFPIAIAVVVLSTIGGAEAVIGVNWGRQASQRLVPSQVVDLLLQNGIRHARVYTSEDDLLMAFAGSGINLTVTMFDPTVLSTMEKARKWVQRKDHYFPLADIRNVFLGGYVFLTGLTDKAYLKNAMNALQYVQAALDEAGHGERVKVTFIHLGLILKNVTRPSEAEFHDEIKDDMTTYVRFLQERKAPFVIEMFPIVDVTYVNMSIDFAFCQNRSTGVITDVNGAVYTNVVESTYDAFVWALRKLNASDVKIVVGMVGWPTDGYEGANVANAERFYKTLLPWAASNKGTPMLPGVPIDVYVHALTDENRMPYSRAFTRHWGIYRSNGQPKFKIDFSGQGRDIFPTTVKGIMHLPERWCVFNGNNTDPEKVKKAFDSACLKSDCTSLVTGGSCSRLSYEQNVSYAFNMLFQFQFQDEDACDFEGLGTMSVVNPSTRECVFPVEVVKGHQNNLRRSVGVQERPNGAVFVFHVTILAAVVWI